MELFLPPPLRFIEPLLLGCRKEIKPTFRLYFTSPLRVLFFGYMLFLVCSFVPELTVNES